MRQLLEKGMSPRANSPDLVFGSSWDQKAFLYFCLGADRYPHQSCVGKLPLGFATSDWYRRLTADESGCYPSPRLWALPSYFIRDIPSLRVPNSCYSLHVRSAFFDLIQLSWHPTAACFSTRGIFWHQDFIFSLLAIVEWVEWAPQQLLSCVIKWNWTLPLETPASSSSLLVNSVLENIIFGDQAIGRFFLSTTTKPPLSACHDTKSSWQARTCPICSSCACPVLSQII